MSKLNIIIPLAGSGKRFVRAGYKKPKPLIDVNGKTMLERVIDNLTPKRRDHKFFFVVMAHHFTDEMKDIMMKTKSYEIILLDSYTDGATCSALKASNLEDGPVLLASCDQIVDFDVDNFLDSVHGLDGALVTYKTTAPNHSFCKVKKGKVVEVAEKKVISDHGNVGIYYFGDNENFSSYAWRMVNQCIVFNGEFYNSLIYNEMIEGLSDDIEIYEVEPKDAHVIGTPDTLRRYIDLLNK